MALIFSPGCQMKLKQGWRFEKHSKNQSPEDTTEHAFPTLLSSFRQDLTTQTSVICEISNDFHQVFGYFLGDW